MNAPAFAPVAVAEVSHAEMANVPVSHRHGVGHIESDVFDAHGSLGDPGGWPRCFTPALCNDDRVRGLFLTEAQFASR